MAKRIFFTALPVCVLIALSAAFLFVSPAFAQDEVPPQVAPTEAPTEVSANGSGTSRDELRPRSAPTETLPTEFTQKEALPTEAAPADVLSTEVTPVDAVPTVAESWLKLPQWKKHQPPSPAWRSS